MHERRTFLALAVSAAVGGCQGSGEETPARTASSPGTASGPEERRTDTGEPDDRSERPEGRDELGAHVDWRHSLDGQVTSLAAPGSGHLFVGTDEGTLASVSPDDGATRWTTSFDGAVSDLLVTGTGTTLVRSNRVEDRLYFQAVDAVRSSSGERLWPSDSTTAGGLATIIGATDETAYIGTGDDNLEPDSGRLYAVSLSDGTEQWSVEVGDPLGGLVTENRVHVTHRYGVEVVGHDGARWWQSEPIPADVVGIATFDDTVVTVRHGEEDGTVGIGYDAATGTQSWRFGEFDVAALTRVGDRLLVGGESLASLDPATGEMQWETDVTARRNREFNVLHDTIAGAQSGGSIYVLDDAVTAVGLADGRVEWRTPLSATETTCVGLLDGQLLFRRSTDEDEPGRRLVALDATSGEQAWSHTGTSEFRQATVGESRAYAGESDALLAFEP